MDEDGLYELARALNSVLSSPSCMDSNGEVANVVDAGYEIAAAIRQASGSLGTGNATMHMGAIEFLALEIHAGLTEVADAIRTHAMALNDVRAAIDGISR